MVPEVLPRKDFWIVSYISLESTFHYNLAFLANDLALLLFDLSVSLLFSLSLIRFVVAEEELELDFSISFIKLL